MFNGLTRFRLECSYVAYMISRERRCLAKASLTTTPRCLVVGRFSPEASLLTLSREREIISRGTSRLSSLCLEAMRDTCLTRVTCP